MNGPRNRRGQVRGESGSPPVGKGKSGAVWTEVARRAWRHLCFQTGIGARRPTLGLVSEQTWIQLKDQLEDQLEDQVKEDARAPF